MTVLFESPTTGQPFGPGVSFAVRSDLVGPVASPRWRVSLSLVSGSLGGYQHVFIPTDFHSFEQVEFMFLYPSALTLVPLLPDYLAASSGYFVAQLLNSSFAVVEQGEVAVTLTWLGLSVLLSRQLQWGVLRGSSDLSSILSAVRHTYTSP